MIGNAIFQHFVDESPDINRNPFRNPTRIDCDKIFTTESSSYDEALKTELRPDVCDELFNSILDELSCDGYATIKPDEEHIRQLNPLVTLSASSN